MKRILLVLTVAALSLAAIGQTANPAATPAPKPQTEYEKAREAYVKGQPEYVRAYVNGVWIWQPNSARLTGLPPWLQSEAAYLEHRKALEAKKREKAGKLNSGGLKTGGL